jgi:hypothetical protein
MEANDVKLGPGVRERFQLASKITRAQRDAAAADRERCEACRRHRGGAEGAAAHRVVRRDREGGGTRGQRSRAFFARKGWLSRHDIA